MRVYKINDPNGWAGDPDGAVVIANNEEEAKNIYREATGERRLVRGKFYDQELVVEEHIAGIGVVMIRHSCC